jgi:hypothetical protein
MPKKNTREDSSPALGIPGNAYDYYRLHIVVFTKSKP